MKPFATTTFGKWILAGEHAVLRGFPALAFPLLSRRLELQFEPTEMDLDVEFKGPHGEELNLLFYGVLDNALKRLRIDHSLKGRFELNSSLPVGTGLGASAALCGAVARWCEAQGWIQTADVYEFARGLEDLFHGESSGVDLAVSLSSQGQRFVRGGERRVFRPLWWPKLYLSYSGQRGMTSECVNKVKRLFETDRARAEELDLIMNEAVRLSESALSSPRNEGLPMLAQAMDLGLKCFNAWDLCPGDLGKHIQELKASGAVAVKPTGSGGGGYVLSLWNEGQVPATWGDRLVEVPPPVL